ncbi:MAG: hypothetical protein AABZ30_03100 [Myxococcota bacterium]
MRVAAGVLLILASFFNLFGGLGYLACGGVAVGAAAVADVDGAGRAGRDRTVLRRGLGVVKAAGGGLMALGLLMTATMGLQIAAAVQLFRARARSFVLTVACLGLAVEGVGIALTTFGWTNALGVVAAALALAGGASIPKTSPTTSAPA